MKIKKLFTLGLTLFLTLTGCFDFHGNNHIINGEYFDYKFIDFTPTIGEKFNSESYNYDIKIKPTTNKLRNDFAYGVDISTVEMVYNCGGVFYNEFGQEQSVYEILKDNGVNFIRLRLWNDPFSKDGISYGAGGNDLKTDLKIMKQAQRVGMNIMLDFHYSDFWADPGHQTIPKAWQDSNNIINDINKYTKEALSYFKNNGIDIAAIQLGNEINNGFLWPKGKLDFAHHDQSMLTISNLLKAANNAAKSIYPNAKTIIHLANPQNRYPFINYLKALKDNEVDYDIIGVTAYPYWQKINGPLFANINEASKKFNKPIMVVETSYGYTFDSTENANAIFGKDQAKQAGYEVSVRGQIKVLNDLIDLLSKIENQMGLGLFYWEPCWLPIKGANAGNSYGQAYQDGNDKIGDYHEWKGAWANQGLFSYHGRMLPSLKTFKAINDSNKGE